MGSHDIPQRHTLICINKQRVLHHHTHFHSSHPLFSIKPFLIVILLLSLLYLLIVCRTVSADRLAAFLALTGIPTQMMPLSRGGTCPECLYRSHLPREIPPAIRDPTCHERSHLPREISPATRDPTCHEESHLPRGIPLATRDPTCHERSICHERSHLPREIPSATRDPTCHERSTCNERSHLP
jgi:hypothetical protein